MDDARPSLLDCTLRDGGYYTNWDFDQTLLDRYLAAMRTASCISAVEIGYRSKPKPDYVGRFFHSPKTLLTHCRSALRADQSLAIMLDEKDVSPADIPGLIGEVAETISMVRFAIAPARIGGAGALVEACNALGVQVALNIMYLNTYCEDASVLAPLAETNAALVALVDSYGGCTPADVGRAVTLAREILPQPIGFHGHDNVSLAFANSVAALGAGAAVIDTTVLGMGRGAGNTKTELMSAYFASKLGHEVDFGAMAAAIDSFSELHKRFEWGANLAYMVSGFEGLPQAEVMDWLGTRRYSMGSIVSALRHRSGGAVDDRTFPDLSEVATERALAARPVLIVGGGGSVAEHLEGLKRFVAESGAVIVHSTTRHASLFDDVASPQIYCLAGQEIARLRGGHEHIISGPDRFIAIQRPPRLPDSVPDQAQVYEVPHWLEDKGRGSLGPIADEPPMDLALAAAESLDAEAVFLAGFDGYADASLADQQNARDVQSALDQAAARWAGRRVKALTPTLYSVERASVYGLLGQA